MFLSVLPAGVINDDDYSARKLILILPSRGMWKAESTSVAG